MSQIGTMPLRCLVGVGGRAMFRQDQGKEKFGSANGNRTRISALKGPRANRCTIAPQLRKGNLARIEKKRGMHKATDENERGSRWCVTTSGGLGILRARPSGWLLVWIRWRRRGRR